jgi:hypothetical protein
MLTLILPEPGVAVKEAPYGGWATDLSPGPSPKRGGVPEFRRSFEVAASDL